MTARHPLLTLLTDFGAGHYVAQLKGVILSMLPQAIIVDIAHDIAPQNVTEAAFVLASAAPAFPSGTVHCAVVDPTVGAERRLILLQASAHFFLAPDNGLLTLLLQNAHHPSAWSVENENFFRRPVSPTFHGRDIFAPVAAALASGERPYAFGPPLDVASLVRLPLPEPCESDGAVHGEVIYVDRFGNLITNITAAAVNSLGDPADVHVSCGSSDIHGISRTYADARSGDIIAVVGSSGRLEISAVNTSAAALLSILPDTPVSRVTLRHS